MSDGTNVKMSFEGLVPSTAYTGYAANYNGYLGFDFRDISLITEAAIDHYGWGDTGFGSVLRGDAEACTITDMIGGQYGYIISSYAGETFNLKSGIFASYRGTQGTFFDSLTAKGHMKGQIYISLSQSATTINFANYGRDFKNVSQVFIYVPVNNSGVTATAMDNLKVHWNGPIPGSGAMKHHVHVSHPLLVGMGSNSAAGHSGFGQTGANGQHNAGYHGELISLVSLTPHDGGLTSEFSLPQAEHFGT